MCTCNPVSGFSLSSVVIPTFAFVVPDPANIMVESYFLNIDQLIDILLLIMILLIVILDSISKDLNYMKVKCNVKVLYARS